MSSPPGSHTSLGLKANMAPTGLAVLFAIYNWLGGMFLKWDWGDNRKQRRGLLTLDHLGVDEFFCNGAFHGR